MFRLMGLHPGPDISAAATARLADADQASARRQLSELDLDCLITEHAPGRYTFHDLLRDYAARQAQTIDGKPETAGALDRVLDYYAQAACSAAILLHPSQDMITFAADSPPGSDTSEGIPFEDAQQAFAWFEAERSNLIASVHHSAESGFDRHAWQLSWFLAAYLASRGYRNERVPLHLAGLAAATRLEDLVGQALSSRLLGEAYRHLRDHDRALDCHRASAELYRQLGDRLGEAETWRMIAAIAVHQGRVTDAADYLEYSLCLQREVGHKAGEARTLVALGMVRGGFGDVSETLRIARQALGVAVECGDLYSQQYAWHAIGYSEQVLGNFTEADTGFQHALSLARKAGYRFEEADVLAHLGDLRHTHGRPREAEEAWSQALIVFNELQHPDADHVRAKLASPGLPGSDLSVEFPVARDPANSAELGRFPRCSQVHHSTGRQPASDTVQLHRPGV